LKCEILLLTDAKKSGFPICMHKKNLERYGLIACIVPSLLKLALNILFLKQGLIYFVE